MPAAEQAQQHPATAGCPPAAPAGPSAGPARAHDGPAAGQPPSCPAAPRVALLTGGFDKPYTFGLATALAAAGILVEIVGGDAIDCPDYHRYAGIRFLNLRSQRGGRARRLADLIVYYARLAAYATRRSPPIFHVIWNGRWETLDRTVLMLYYRALGKRVLLTAHNVNAAVRDGGNSLWNRLTLRIQYRLANHIFVHTEAMKRELSRDFSVRAGKVTVIPFGLNNSLPETGMPPAEARRRLGLGPADRVILFFGNIRPYKGLEYLAAAFPPLAERDPRYRLVIAGPCQAGNEAYWDSVRALVPPRIADRVLLRIEQVPDAEAEAYFRAADVMALPYTHVYQSGVLFTGFAFGLPAVAADVGALREEIRDGENGFTCPPRDAAALAGAIQRFFSSDLYRNLDTRRPEIAAQAEREHSWTAVAAATAGVYAAIAGARRDAAWWPR
jgi:glycosyltransferase involved in cell wall biosynthesis